MSLIRQLNHLGHFDKLNREYEIQQKLQKELGGKCEVWLADKSGRIDLLTQTELIEIKRAQNWQKGVKQLEKYHQEYPNRQKRLHLFALQQCSQPNELYEKAKSVCQLKNIKLTWEP